MAEDVDKWTVVERATEAAVAAGMETPLRKPILDGVDAGREIPVKEKKRIPFAVVFLTLSFLAGYLVGKRSNRR